MPKYLLKGRFTPSGIEGVMKAGGTARKEVLSKVAESVGGRLEAYYFAFGDPDVYVICDLPDNATAARIAMTVTAAGAATAETVVLLTPEEIDAASQAGRVPYTPPGS
jgi:uncharacterized protein with GYD domain